MAWATNKELADGPLAGAGLFNSCVFDFCIAGTVVEGDLAAQEFSEQADLAAALFKLAIRDGSSSDDLAATDARYASNRDKHTSLTGKFCEESHDAGSIVLAIDHEDITNATQAVTRGVENAAACQARYKYSCSCHVSNLPV